MNCYHLEEPQVFREGTPGCSKIKTENRRSLLLLLIDFGIAPWSQISVKKHLKTCLFSVDSSWFYNSVFYVCTICVLVFILPSLSLLFSFSPFYKVLCDYCFSLISDQLSHPPQEDGLSPRDQELKDLKESLQDTQPVGVLVDCCRTMDQVRTSLQRATLYFYQV